MGNPYHISRRSNPATTLDCWREVGKFKSAVAHVEQVLYVFFEAENDLTVLKALYRLSAFIDNGLGTILHQNLHVDIC
jgi:hypothetical protein